ncbi:hypothetical protein C8J57DRAFT_223567 [Mycena rebaudengoi]|nr:hypothetical protein C8J57DRAFT_223567 [Mycena rebaudengoi]
MYSHINPYATWSTSNAPRRGTLPAPSVHGALPFTADPSASTSLTFYFTALNPTILNCTVVGRNTFPYFSIVTDASMPGYTAFKNTDGKIIALIEWKRSPLVEIRDVFSKQLVNTWLPLSRDSSHRTMKLNGQEFIWAPQKSTICLYPAGTATPELLARICRAEDGTVSLELTSAAISGGLLETSVVATVLLQCGHKID